jgi:maltokinase
VSAEFPGVEQLLVEWLPHQRWFGGKGREIAAAHGVSEVLQAGDPAVWTYLLHVEFSDGGSDTFFIPISVRSQSSEALGYALIGEVATPDGSTVYVHDALHDRDVTPLWTVLLDEAAKVGSVSFLRQPDVQIPTDLPGDALTVEQSNTSLVYGEAAIMKFFRRIEPGRNPDVEVHEALRETDNPHLAPLFGYVTSTVDGDEPATLAMAQSFLPAASDGWAQATASVRDLYAEGDLHPDEVGGDFAGDAHRLGAATASVHADLARVLPTSDAGEDWLETTAAVMRERLVEACVIVPALAEHADALRATYDALAGLTVHIRLQRVHGDLHLGQVLRTTSGWTILDFEGEPARPIAERRSLSTPLRDVASMLRSFDYAARSLLLDGQEDSQLAYRATEWSSRNRGAFCAGYGEESGEDPREQAVLLRALEADKAVYETIYEARNRPAWLSIPLRSLERITSEEPQ